MTGAACSRLPRQWTERPLVAERAVVALEAVEKAVATVVVVRVEAAREGTAEDLMEVREVAMVEGAEHRVWPSG